MDFDAIVLAGGRSARLGGVPKARLELRGRTLLQHALAACAGATRTVVVGPAADELDPGILVAREQPPFGGPAAGVAAGLRALARAASAAPLVLVLACDMPRAEAGVARLLGERQRLAVDPAIPHGVDGLHAVDEAGRSQPLLALYLRDALDAAVRRHAPLDDLSMRTLLNGLALAPVTVPAGATADVDNWEDARVFGIARPAAGTEGEQ